MAEKIDETAKRKYLLRRFWLTARGFWTRGNGTRAWYLTGALIVIVVMQVYVSYQINVWNRAIFDALEQKNGSAVLLQAAIFVPLALASIALAISIVYARNTTQRRWRRWLTDHTVGRWLTNGRYFHLNLVAGDHDNPEYRMAEDIRVATEAPIDFGAGILSAFLSAATFIAVLWFVGGNLTFQLGGTMITVPGFLVIAAVVYAVLASGAMAFIGRSYVAASETKMQAEAELRYALTRLRENGESIALIAGEEEEKSGLDAALEKVLSRWREVMRQYMRTTTVAQTSFLVAPVIPIILSAPKYLDGTMTLGQVMQAASAFVTVQTAFNWLVDNYPRFADWAASARRVASLMVSLDALEKAEAEGTFGRITRSEAPEGTAMKLRDVSVTLDNGTVIVKDADVEIAPGERVLFVGEVGLGQVDAGACHRRPVAMGQGRDQPAQERQHVADAAEAVHPDRCAPPRGDLPQGSRGSERRRGEGGAASGRSRPAQGPHRRGGPLGPDALRRREAAHGFRAPPHPQARYRGHGRIHGGARQEQPGAADAAHERAPAENHRGQRRPSPRARGLPRAQDRARAPPRRRPHRQRRGARLRQRPAHEPDPPHAAPGAAREATDVGGRATSRRPPDALEAKTLMPGLDRASSSQSRDRSLVWIAGSSPAMRETGRGKML